MMSLFDDSENIMFIGSDSAKIWIGKDQISGHFDSIFPKESVSLCCPLINEHLQKRNVSINLRI